MKARQFTIGNAATLFRSALLVSLAVSALVLGLASPSSGQDKGKSNANPGVIPPNSKAYGMTYGEWSAEWWKWGFSLPVDAHPLFDTADCSEGQSGPVWFLGGTFAAIEIEPGVILGQVTRDCTIPVGKALFFPLLNTECSTLEGNGTTEDELRDCAEFFASFTVPESLFCIIDGQAVKKLLPDFEVESPLYTFGPLPENNLLGVDEGLTSLSVGDGVYVMLPPLAVGKHTLHFGGVADYTAIGGPMFIEDITYNITVKNPGK